jgi:hypothetical protein
MYSFISASLLDNERAMRLIPLTQVRLYVVSPPRRFDWSAFVDFLD